MAVHRRKLNPACEVWERFRIVLEMIKFEHTIFALPFAMISVLICSRDIPHGYPSIDNLFWILIALVSARSAAMAFNRIADARYDAENPRTASRAIPAGILSLAQVWVFTITAVLIFELAASRLNRLCFILSPLALFALLGYSYTKRFTPLAHLALGIAIGIAPIGAWVAITGRISLTSLLLGAVVMLWIGGFDIIYALQDVDYDCKAGLRSLPQTIGRAPSLDISRFMHLCMVILLIIIGLLSGLHAFYALGVCVVAGLIWYEHSLVSPEDISRVNIAFFTLNGWISVSLFFFVLMDRIFIP